MFFMTWLRLRRVPRRLLGLDESLAREAVEIGSLSQNLYKWLHCFTYLSGFSLSLYQPVFNCFSVSVRSSMLLR